jgi:hypothetical protein
MNIVCIERRSFVHMQRYFCGKKKMLLSKVSSHIYRVLCIKSVGNFSTKSNLEGMRPV